MSGALAVIPGRSYDTFYPKEVDLLRQPSRYKGKVGGLGLCGVYTMDAFTMLGQVSCHLDQANRSLCPSHHNADVHCPGERKEWEAGIFGWGPNDKGPCEMIAFPKAPIGWRDVASRR
ncbi:hypothetical protein M406DRAFT_70375 [Cryphonectria parasitica EP155]|uniref:Uncharacterized protein n=1 Tax=Cryphonectria parasitica (strain ATCC 38755 / EP155) TaxID=660469 RepID=A0A9P5CPL9_CRYP1|nr:uncharacterized protein M406DRAFT_70375 [Cryphonectria parasitica EP155]KAF3765125.1 hypothetical protein M406DRAFT_70375 [Cryphonectria parasitica EP155]